MTSNTQDRFDDNLRALGATSSVPEGPSASIRGRCQELLDDAGHGSAVRRLRRPLFASSLGLAAVLAVVAFFLPLSSHRGTVNAELILTRLNEQLHKNPVVDVTIEDLAVDELASANGHLQISESGIGGDLSLKVREDEGTIEVDLSLGLSNDSKWVLIRKLFVPVSEPAIQGLLMFMFPPGSETLIILPADFDGDDDHMESLQEVIEAFRSKELIAVLQVLVENQKAQGGKVKTRSDGLVELSMSLSDEAALEALADAFDKASDDDDEDEEKPDAAQAELKGFMRGVKAERNVKVRAKTTRESTHEAEWADAMLHIVYDPAAGQVQSLRVSDIGTAKGSVSVALRDGLDASLLDMNRVTTPATRRIDFATIADMFELQTKAKISGKK